jgi:hypothetical protein
MYDRSLLASILSMMTSESRHAGWYSLLQTDTLWIPNHWDPQGKSQHHA